METPQPDKTGMRILLKLASLVVILAGIHAAADIIVQLLLVYSSGSTTPRCHYDCGCGDADRTHRAGRRTGGIV